MTLPDEKEVLLHKAITTALRSYNIVNQNPLDENGELKLSDLLTPAWEKTIKVGEEELEFLADHIFTEVKFCPAWNVRADAAPKMKAGDRIRVPDYFGDTEDFTVEEFRHCLGIFKSNDHREAQNFTPLCELYEPAPDAKQGYIGNYGPTWSAYVPVFMNIPKPHPMDERK